MSEKFTTYVLMRFAYFAPVNFMSVTKDLEKDKNYLFDRARLSYRLELFKTFCLPSLKKQTDPNFKLIIITSPELPDDFRQALKDLCQGLDFHISDQFPDYQVAAFAKAMAEIRPESDRFDLTIRLDDDDAIGSNWVREVRMAASFSQDFVKEFFGLAINPGSGAVINFNHPRKPLVEVRAELPCSAGVALLVPCSPENVYRYQHQDIGKEMPLLTIPTPLSFLRTLHSTNISHIHDVKQFQSFEPFEGPDIINLDLRLTEAFGIDFAKIDELEHYQDPYIKVKRA